MSSLEIIGFGAMNLDTLYRVQNVVVDDETIVEEYQSFPGGSAANTIYGLAKLGITAGFIGAIGDDEAGRTLLRDFKDTGVDTSQIRVKGNAKTGVVLGLIDRYGRRALYVAPEANSLLRKEDIGLEHIQQASLIHLSSFVDDQQFELQKWVVTSIPASTKVSFAPGAIYARRGLNALTPILAKTYVMFANQNEVEELTGADYRAAARFLLKEGCKIVVVTLGKGELPGIIKQEQLTFDSITSAETPSPNKTSSKTNGNNEWEPIGAASYITDGNNEYIIESKEGEIKDTTGAGDAFAAGVLYGLLSDKGLRDCGLLGESMARFCIRGIGARAGLPSLPALAHSYQEVAGSPL